MRLQMRCVDHDLLRLAAFARQFPEYFIEDSQPAPAYEPIIDGLMRAIFPRRVAPAQAVLDHKDDAAHDPTIVHARDPVRERKILFDPTHPNAFRRRSNKAGREPQSPPA